MTSFFSAIFSQKVDVLICAHLKGNFLNFPILTLLLSLVHLQGVLWAFKRKSPFYGDTLYVKMYMSIDAKAEASGLSKSSVNIRSHSFWII